MEKNLNQLIAKITNDLNIEDIIGHYISIEKKGNNAVAICPFHQDSNPSLSISNSKKIFKCFVCNEGGNGITFVQKYKKVEFIEAIKIIADDFNLNWKDYFKTQEKIENPKIKEIKNINLEALNFYKYNLKIELEKNNNLRDYLNKRKITEDLLDAFAIGWAKNDNSLKQYLLKKNFKEEEILRASLIRNNEGRLHDLFFNRLIFPIIDQDKQVLGFSGRIIDDKGTIKYLNSSENLLFNKSKILYNLNNSFEEILFKNEVIIVEGFMDVISFYKIGIKNVCASMGTAFNINHVEKLKKITKNFVLAFDNDQAGIETTIKTYNILKRHNLNISVINLSDGKDIDEIINNNIKITQDYFETRKINFLDFYYQKIIEKQQLDTLKQEKLEEILKVILTSDDILKKEIILNKTKDKFGENLITNFIKKINLSPIKTILNNQISKQKNLNRGFFKINNQKFTQKYDQEEFELLFDCFLIPTSFSYLRKINFIFVNNIYREIFKSVNLINEAEINSIEKLTDFLDKFLINNQNDNFKKIIKNFLLKIKIDELNKNENLIKKIKNINIENQVRSLAYKWRILGKENYKKDFIETITANDNDEEYDYILEKLKNS
ncbi:MAG: DNA primase [Candidatus Hepatoplasma scabrum]|nr:MAG: DNA primase [Candidatus Hepatoplasma sp.]